MTLEIDGQWVLGFDTGLDSRAFAQAKFARFITEPGYIVNWGTGNTEIWQASGVTEIADASGSRPTMVVWGPLFEGNRLDLLLADDGQRDIALAAIVCWVKAILALGENFQTPLWPCAAMIKPGAVFFAPPGLALHCVTGEADHFSGRCVHPDLNGITAASFTTAVMLYRIFAGTLPFSAADEIILRQDMREGNFLPVRFAVPGLEGRLAAVMQSALSRPAVKGGNPATGRTAGEAPDLNEFLAVLQPAYLQSAGSCSSLVYPLSNEERLSLEKEKVQFLKVKNASVNARRFVARNTGILLGGFAAVAIVVLAAFSLVKNRAELPTTAGMDSVQVIETYYHSFGEFDHQMMEACVMRGVGKNDIGTVVNVSVINKVRQAYELNTGPSIISAEEWQKRGGGVIDAQVFGVTDLHITVDSRQEAESGDEFRYRVDYTLWIPVQGEDDPNPGLPQSFKRSDIVTLVRSRGNLRISEIRRSF